MASLKKFWEQNVSEEGDSGVCGRNPAWREAKDSELEGYWEPVTRSARVEARTWAPEAGGRVVSRSGLRKANV